MLEPVEIAAIGLADFRLGSIEAPGTPPGDPDVVLGVAEQSTKRPGEGTPLVRVDRVGEDRGQVPARRGQDRPVGDPRERFRGRIAHGAAGPRSADRAAALSPSPPSSWIVLWITPSTGSPP